MSYNSHGFDIREGQRARINNFNVKVVRTSGTVMTTGAGEGLFDVTFASPYIEKPAMSMGGELAPTTVLVAGSYPTVSVIVGTWVLQTTVGSPSVFYLGARLVIVTTGPVDQQVIVHWQAEGKAFTLPLPGTGTA